MQTLKHYSLFFLLFCTSTLVAQRFRPYHAYGLQFNLNFSSLVAEHSGHYGNVYGGEDLSNLSTRFDVYAHYDYGIIKWLGVGTGLGYSLRGGRVDNPNNPDWKGKRNLSYLNVPIRLQIKPWHFLWIEPGVEVLYYLGYSDEGEFESPYKTEGPFDPDAINSIGINGSIALRFNVFRGLSLNAGYIMGLSDVATAEAPSPPYPFIATTYRHWGTFVGLRYMLNQPDKGGR